MIVFGLVERWRGVPLPNVIFWAAIILLVFVACYKAWLTEHEIAEYYRGKLTPKLELVFDDKIPFVEYVQERGRVGKSGFWKVFRVGVKNVSEIQLFGVSVEVENFETQKRTYENIPLRVMHDVGEFIQKEKIYDAPQQKRFSIRPGRTEYVDVVMREMHPQREGDHKSTLMCFIKTFSIINSIGLMQPLKITVVVSADDASPTRKHFEIFVDDKDQLQMKEVEQEQAHGVESVTRLETRKPNQLQMREVEHEQAHSVEGVTKLEATKPN